MPNDYLSSLGLYETPEQLLQGTGKFLSKYMKLRNFVLMKHRVHPDPFVCLLNHYEDLDLSLTQNSLKNFNIDVCPYQPVKYLENYYCFGEGDFTKNDVIFIVSKNKIPESVIDVMRSYDSLSRQCRQVREAEKIQNQTEYTGIISQLMHDVASLLNLSRNIQNPDELTERIHYQERANTRLLQYIRKPELFLTEIGVNELILDTIALMEISAEKLNLKINSNREKIQVDVELFSKALIEIIKNSIEAVDNDLSGISISVDMLSALSPFNKKSWMRCEIRDTGNGISEDFKEFVGTPFFTTVKNKGHTGLGLPISEKIINAHKGYLEVNSVHGSGTVVTLYLPSD
ncbi:MAG: ATP-binding protein [Calditrichaceae bacterium]